MKLRLLASVCTVLSLLVLPAAAAAQVCIGNSAERTSLSSVNMSTGAVDLPHDMGLHMVGAGHLTEAGGFFGIAQSEYGVQYGTLTGHPNGDAYDVYAYRGGGRWLFGLPVPSDLAGPGALGACVTVGTRLSTFGYTMRLEAIEDNLDSEVGAWHFSMALPITVGVGYSVTLNESMDLIPYVEPGVSPYWGGLITEQTADSEEGTFGTGTDYFTTVGVALNHTIFRAALVLRSGMMEFGGGTRIGLEGGIRW